MTAGGIAGIDPGALQTLLALVASLKGTDVQKAVTGTPTTIYGHGTGGLFSHPGLEPEIVNAMVMPRLGLLDAIPSRTANTDSPLFGLMTGVTASTGEEPSGVCDDPPTAGLMKLCMHSFVWGRMSRATREIDIDRLGRFRDRSDFNDLRLLGQPQMANPLIPQARGASANPQQALRNEIAKLVFELAVSWGRDFARLLYTGNPTNNTANGGYKEPYGLDILINDGYRDAESGTVCAAADSLMRDFGSLDVATNGDALVNTVTYITRNLMYIADRAGLSPVEWVIVMPWALFYEITAVWPCAYLTYRCQVDNAAGERVNIDAGDQIAMRDAMRQGEYLVIDGRKVRVLLDDAAPETALPGSSFSASIRWVPLRVMGGTPATYLEYFNYDAPGAAMDGARAFGKAESFWTTNGGRFLWVSPAHVNYCIKMLAKTEWRVILLTPHIAARLDNVKYTPLIKERNWDVDGSFYVDGGRTDRNGYDHSYYTPTN